MVIEELALFQAVLTNVDSVCFVSSVRADADLWRAENIFGCCCPYAAPSFTGLLYT